jgi:hypothetical protein
MKAESFATLKLQEARRRMSALAQARRNPKLTAGLQRRASLVNGAAKWKIVNLEQSFAAMAKWGRSGR